MRTKRKNKTKNTSLEAARPTLNFAQICEFKTREKIPCCTYVLISVTQKILETKKLICEKEVGQKSAKYNRLTSSQRGLTYARTFMFQNCLVNTPKYSKLCMYRYGELTFSYSFFSIWTHKLRFLAKLLHIPKRAKNVFFP
jgi:hypothetical protein